MSAIRYCDGAASTTPCPHPHNCTVDCQFSNGVVTRTIKPYPAVPDDNVVEEATEQWRSISDMLGVAVWAAVLVIVTLLVFSCLFMWGKLV